jgi:hypothetical protein
VVVGGGTSALVVVVCLVVVGVGGGGWPPLEHVVAPVPHTCPAWQALQSVPTCSKS